MVAVVVLVVAVVAFLSLRHSKEAEQCNRNIHSKNCIVAIHDVIGKSTYPQPLIIGGLNPF